MAESSVLPEIEPCSASAAFVAPTPCRRITALALVLTVSFAHFIFAGFYYLIAGLEVSTGYQRQASVVSAMIAEATSLLLLWYVLSEHHRSWKEFGWGIRSSDITATLVLIVVTLVASRLAYMFFQAGYGSITGHFLQPRSTHGVLGAGVSVAAVFFVLLNPFFEELIVRGYTMSEVIELGGSRTLAILISVGIQLSYHLYQGLLLCVAHAVTFLIFSIYFAKARRILPIILAHLFFDVFALLRVAS